MGAVLERTTSMVVAPKRSQNSAVAPLPPSFDPAEKTSRRRGTVTSMMKQWGVDAFMKLRDCRRPTRSQEVSIARIVCCPCASIIASIILSGYQVAVRPRSTRPSG